MKRDHPKRKIYLRIFSLLLAIYLILMLAFSTFFSSKQKKIAMMDLQTDGLYLSTSIERIIKDYVSNNQIIDITKVRKELVNTLYLEPDTELAFFTGDYELVYNTNPYWTASYTSQVVGNNYYTDYAYINPEDWFSDEESQEIEDYLYAAPKAEKVGDLSGYAVYVEGFWLDNEMMIPKTMGLSKKSIKTERMEKTMSFSIRSVSLFLKLVWEFAAHFSMLWAIATIPNSVRTL